MRESFMRKLQSSKHKTSRTTKDAQVNQEELLVARDKRIYQKIYSRIHKMLAEQSLAYEESWRTLLIGNIKQTMARN